MLSDPTFWLALGGTAVVVAIAVLKFVAPRTATTKDDAVLALLEKAVEALKKAEPVPTPKA